MDEPTDDPTPPNFADDPPATTIVGRRSTRDGSDAGVEADMSEARPSRWAYALAKPLPHGPIYGFTSQPT